MRSLIFILTAILMVAVSDPSNPSLDVFMKFFKDYKVIQETDHPVFYQGLAYYWYGSYTPSPERPESCIILASHPEWPFDGYVFKNGTIPTVALFGCHLGATCRGTRCVEPLTHFNVVTYTLVGMVIFLLICLFGGEPKIKKQQNERPRRELPREPTMDNIFLPQEHRVRFAVPPGYSQ